jgi:hypothetical protein
MPLTEGTHATGAEETLYEEGVLSGKTPAEGAGGAKETTGAARTGGGRVQTQWAISGTEETWDRPEGSW